MTDDERRSTGPDESAPCNGGHESAGVSEHCIRVYLAGPLFCQAERVFNLQLTAKIEALGFSVFLPQRDGVEAEKAPYAAMSKDERRQAMFELDLSEISRSDVFLFVLDGRVPDEGACVELGFALAQRRAGAAKHLIGLQTDQRAAFIGARLNPMLRLALDTVVNSEAALLENLNHLIRRPRG